MAAQEDPELTSSQEHNEFTLTDRTISSEEKLRAEGTASVQQMREREEREKQVSMQHFPALASSCPTYTHPSTAPAEV